jgi:HlyD family secretion protein
MKRKYILGSAILVTISLILWKGCFSTANDTMEVVTKKISRKTVIEVVSVTGKIKPKTEVKISPDVSGEIIEMYVAEGDSVRKGQLLLTINPEIYLTTLNQVIANLNNAKANLAAAEAQEYRAAQNEIIGKETFERQQRLYKENVISAQEFDNARIQYQQLRTEALVSSKSKLAALYNVKSLEARLEEGQKTLGRTKIIAPESGIVTQLNSAKGERVVGTAQMAGTEIMRISNLNLMEVEVQINENDIVRIQLGDEADVKVNAYRDRIFKGKVTEIANSAKFNATQSVNEQVSNYTVKVLIDVQSYSDLISTKRSTPFWPGMTASVDIKTETREQTLAIPIAAVTTRNPKPALYALHPLLSLKDIT